MRVFLSIFLAAFLASDAITAHAGQERPYHLLVIMTDEHNFRTLGCYRELIPPSQAYMWGKAVVETPSIDWFAKNHAQF